MSPDLALRLIVAELHRAQAKHPAFHSGHEGYAVILEELDELWAEIKCDCQTGAAGFEAVQVAAMALRFLIDRCTDEAVEAFTRGAYGVMHGTSHHG